MSRVCCVHHFPGHFCALGAMDVVCRWVLCVYVLTPGESLAERE